MPKQVVGKLWAQLELQGASLIKRPEIGYYLFCSFDLVNSTALKASYKLWPIVINAFNEWTIDGIAKRVPRLTPWKLLGDEVVFCKRVYHNSEINTLLPGCYDTLKAVIFDLHRQFPKLKPLISVRATAWGALCLDATGERSALKKELEEKEYQNIRIQHPTRSSHDFLGPEIDAGFRLQEFAPRGRFAISAELAYLIFRNAGAAKVTRRLKIVSFERLKGIWNDRYYPVLWYEEKWKELNKTFRYDEKLENPLVARLLKNKAQPIEQLEKIFSELDLKYPLEKELAFLRKFPPVSESAVTKAAPITTALPVDTNPGEVHCVALCFNSKGDCLVAKRRATKRRFPNKWEFGCGQLRRGESFEECICQAYDRDFGLKLDTSSFQPIDTYTIKENPLVPGIIFLVRALNPTLAKANQHAKVRWISENGAKRLKTSSCVPNFHRTLATANKMITGF